MKGTAGERRVPSGDGTLILMVEDRDPLEMDVFRAPYYSLTAAINFRYARRHGCAFQYHLAGGVEPRGEDDRWDARQAQRRGDTQRRPASWWRRRKYALDVRLMSSRCLLSIPSSRLDRRLSTWERLYASFRQHLMPSDPGKDAQKGWKDRPACVHARWGPRAVPWTKLLAVNHAMAQGYDRIVYIDSDAIFNRFEMSVDDFLMSSKSALAALEGAALTLTFNYPWTEIESTSGFMVWQNTELAKRILHHWWNVDAGDYHLEHDYEQHALNHHVLKDASGYREHIAIIPAISFVERRRQYVRHVSIAHSRVRLPRFRYALKACGVDADRYGELMDEIGQHHLVRLDTCEDRINEGERSSRRQPGDGDEWKPSPGLEKRDVHRTGSGPWNDDVA